MSTTLKYRLFVAEDMNHKPVTELPGIGTTLGNTLAESGFPLAKDIYSIIKTFDFDKVKFQEWMKTVCGASSKHSSDCYEAFKKWHDQFGKEAEKNKGKANTSRGKCDCKLTNY